MGAVVAAGKPLSLVGGGSPKAAQAAPNVAFLDVLHPIYAEHHKEWRREEKRLYGGHLVLDELVRFDYEDDKGAAYKSRLTYASYINLPKLHAALITGHVSKKRPKPGSGLSFGTMGDIRSREKITGAPTRAEIAYYNCDGVGVDGSEWPVWWDGVADRAEATGFRWIMVEVPRRDPLLQEELTAADEEQGARPFLVEYSPLRVTNWWHHDGELQFAVIRPTVDEPLITPTGTLYMPQLAVRGYYLLVREGCRMLGDAYADGGWWLFNSLRQLIDNGDWSKTLGKIPLFPAFAEQDPGTDEHPALARSQTMELGQSAIGIMNMISARDWDAMEAASSKMYLLGVDPKVAQVVADGMKSSQLVCVPPIEHQDGTVTTPEIHDGSMGAVAASVFKTAIADKFAEAERLMLERATSDKASSGAKQVASFAEASSPLLVRRARNRQQAESTAIYFMELRYGITSQPTGYALYPDSFELAPLVDDIDAMFDTIRRSGAESASLATDMIIQALQERGIEPEDVPLATVKKELLESLKLAAQNKNARANLMQGLNTLTRPNPSGMDQPARLPPLPPGPGGTPPGGAGNPPNPEAQGN